MRPRFACTGGIFGDIFEAQAFASRSRQDGVPLTVSAVIPPKNGSPEEMNREYTRRFQATQEAAWSEFGWAHSWGILPWVWARLHRRPRALFISAPATRDTIRPLAAVGARVLGVPGGVRVAEATHRLNYTELEQADLPIARKLGASLPAGIVGAQGALAQYDAVSNGVRLDDIPFTDLAERVVVFLGMKDRAIRSSRVADHLARKHPGVRVVAVATDHWPDLVTPGLFTCHFRAVVDWREVLAPS